MCKNTQLIVVLICLHLVLCIAENSSIITKGCTDKCLHCSSVGCVKCKDFIVNPSRECVTNCPRGFNYQWSTEIDYMGRMCVHSGYIAGLSAENAAIVVGLLTGILICFLIITSGIFYLKYIKRKVSNLSSETTSDVEDSPERKDFLKQLEILRPQAPMFLSMLNDTRRQIRELHSNGDNTAITAYKPVVRDLAKILLLLNRNIDKISVIPDDWDHLFSWGEKVLKRYKRMSDQPQVAQLVSFLQAPIIMHENTSSNYSNTLSTFKPNQQYGSSISLKDIAINNFNSNYDNTFTPTINPHWNFNFSLVNSTPITTSGYCGSWQNNRDYLCSSYLVEDDFFQFGFRPQDEITTEL